jgi:F420-dependent oxidoreductase-like protein
MGGKVPGDNRRERMLPVTTYGLQLPNFTFARLPDAQLFDRVSSMAEAAESSGFSSLWVMDHFYQLPALGGPDQPMLEAYSLLGALSVVTREVSLGTLVTGVTYRNPAVLAKQVTTLDVLSGGRAWLGIGAAWHDEEHEGLGVDFPPAGERLDRLEEALQICRAMFREDRVSFEGRYYAVREARNVPRPIRPGGVPILVGGSGPRRTLRLVAQYADACNVSGGPETVRRHLEILEGHCADLGRDSGEIAKTRLGSLFLTGSPRESDTLLSSLAEHVGGETVQESMTVADRQTMAEKLGALASAGLDELIFNLPLASGPDDVGVAGQLLAETLEPRPAPFLKGATGEH